MLNHFLKKIQNWTEKEENQLKKYRQKCAENKLEKNAKKFKAFV